MAEVRTQSHDTTTDDDEERLRHNFAEFMARRAGAAAVRGEKRASANEVRRFTTKLGRRTAELLQEKDGADSSYQFVTLDRFVVGRIHQPDARDPQDPQSEGSVPVDPAEIQGWILKSDGNVGGSKPRGYMLTTEGQLLRYSVSKGVYNYQKDPVSGVSRPLRPDEQQYQDKYQNVKSAITVLHDNPDNDYFANHWDNKSAHFGNPLHAVRDDQELQNAMVGLLEEYGLSDQVIR